MSSHSRPYGVAEAMEEVVARARARPERDERAEVAREVREVVARSGFTSTEFARRIGTSRSRLSTYASGRVVPSAALMVRIRHVAGPPDRDAERAGAVATPHDEKVARQTVRRANSS
ncbi:MAG: helix-turn-helix domain-containing protein [Kineosporiaceae bacterium]